METTTEEKNKAKTAKLRLVLIDETRDWNEDIAKACGKIMRPYLYDANQHTYCCEVTPSYTLYPLPSIAENEISDEVYDDVMEGDNENPDVVYMHVSDVDKMETKKAVFSHHLDGGLRYYNSEGKKYREIIEAAEEYFRGNAPY